MIEQLEAEGSRDRELGAVRLLGFVLAVGMFAGFGELVLLALRSWMFDRRLWLGPHAMWMAPVANVLVLLPVGCVILAVTTRRPRWRARLLSTVALFLAAWSLGLHVPGIAEWSVLVIAAAVAWQGGGLLERRRALVAWMGTRGVTVLSALVVVLGVGVALRDRMAERSALAAIPAASPGLPNLLWIVVDTERAQSLGLHGYERPTSPNLDRLAESSVVFDWAIAPSSWTLPSHASMFTGRYAHRLETDWQVPLGPEDPTVAERLASLGYTTGAFIGNTYYVIPEFGMARGFTRFEAFTISLEEVMNSGALLRRLANDTRLRLLLGRYHILGNKVAATINEDMLRWLDRSGEGPFFAFLNYMDTHEPYLPPSPFDREFGGTEERRDFSRTEYGLRYVGLWPWRRPEMTEDALRAEQDAYDGTIGYVDRQIGLLLDGLGARGLLDETIVIVTSDHGELFGEHVPPGGRQPLYTHGHSLYLGEVHVPLLIHYPAALPGGVRVPDPVSLRDLPATIWHLVRPGDPSPFPGVSLVPLWEEPAAGHRGSPALSSVVPAGESARHFSLVAAGHHYMRWGRGQEQLFDLTRDPGEAVNLVEAPSAGDLLRAMRATVDSLVDDR